MMNISKGVPRNFQTVGPFLRLLSAYNRVWYELQRSVRWSRQKYRKIPSGYLPGVSTLQEARIQELKRRYGVRAL